jgi:tetratricopeptide (TPR) repeat protein
VTARLFSRLGLVVLTLGCAVALAPAFAQKATPTPPKKERKATGSLSESTYRQLERIQTLMAENKNAEAEAKIIEMLGRVSSDYEKALLYQTQGFLYAAQGNYKKAIPPFELAVKLDALPQQPYEQMLLALGQLLYSDGQMDKAIARLEQYVAESINPTSADAHIMLASAYVEKKRFRDALPQVDTALGKVKTPKESWLQLKLAIHYELKQYPQCAEVLVSLIAVAPVKEDYWKQLSSILFEIKRDQESLAVLALAERRGFIDDDREIRNLANVYLLLDIPLKAAQLIEKGLESKAVKEDEKIYTTLSDAWILARELDKAEKALLRAAAISDRGDNYYRLGQIYVEDEKWKQALDALDKAQKKGLTKVSEAAFLTGVAAFNAGQTDRAKASLRKALNDDDTRKMASQWLAHIEQLEAEAAAMEAYRLAREAAAAEAEAEAAQRTGAQKP